MPQHASAKKRMLTSERDKTRNRAVKSQVRKSVKELQETLGTTDAKTQLSRTHSTLDKASKKGVIHPKKVDRMKSRLAKAVAREATA